MAVIAVNLNSPFSMQRASLAKKSLPPSGKGLIVTFTVSEQFNPAGSNINANLYSPAIDMPVTLPVNESTAAATGPEAKRHFCPAPASASLAESNGEQNERSMPASGLSHLTSPISYLCAVCPGNPEFIFIRAVVLISSASESLSSPLPEGSLSFSVRFSKLWFAMASCPISNLIS